MSFDALGAILLVAVFDVQSRDAVAAAGAHSGSGEDESLATLGGGKHSAVGWREEEGTGAAIVGVFDAATNFVLVSSKCASK